MLRTLSDIGNGTTVVVKGVAPSTLRVKLFEMGISEGKTLKMLYRAPFGDPLAIDVSGYVLSLRRDEAALIEVETELAES